MKCRKCGNYGTNIAPIEQELCDICYYKHMLQLILDEFTHHTGRIQEIAQTALNEGWIE